MLALAQHVCYKAIDRCAAHHWVYLSAMIGISLVYGFWVNTTQRPPRACHIAALVAAASGRSSTIIILCKSRQLFSTRNCIRMYARIYTVSATHTRMLTKIWLAANSANSIFSVKFRFIESTVAFSIEDCTSCHCKLLSSCAVFWNTPNHLGVNCVKGMALRELFEPCSRKTASARSSNPGPEFIISSYDSN